MSEQIAVIGAGIIGLTTSLRLQEAGFDVRIFSKQRTGETTSAIAAAFWYPYQVASQGKVQLWAEQTYKEYLEQISQGVPGVRSMRLVEYFRDDLLLPEWKEQVEEFSLLSAEELPPGFSSGFGFSSVLTETSRYLPYLVEKVRNVGIEIETVELDSLQPLLSEYSTVVNCAGLGARELVGDDSLYPIRGQLTRTTAFPSSFEEKIIIYEEAEHASYIVPRSEDCILGGTAEVRDWDQQPRSESTISIRQRCELLEPSVSELRDQEFLVGLRPGRPEVRLETQAAAEDTLVIHNYGHGGAGFTLCWGCAEEVRNLLTAR